MSTENLTPEEQAALAEGERISQGLEANQQEPYKATEDEAQAANTKPYAGKYATAEELEKAYLELQQKLGKQDKEEQEPVTEEPPAKEEPPAEPSVTLSIDEQREIVDTIGGVENYQKLMEWGDQNLPEADQVAYNQAIQTNNKDVIKLATEALYAKYRANADVQGNLIKGQGDTLSGPKPFRSRAELSAAISDPRYDRDPAYRMDVTRRVQVSPDNLL